MRFIETSSLSEEEIGAYCRKKGIYTNNLIEWKHAIIEGLKPSAKKEHKAEVFKLKSIVKALKFELTRKRKSSSRNRGITCFEKKSKLDLGGRKGRLINFADRCKAVFLINEAIAKGARKHLACKLLNITLRTFQRWIQNNGIIKEDQRLYSKIEPKNKLTLEERAKVISIVTSKKIC